MVAPPAGWAKFHKEQVLKNDIHDLGLVLDSKVKLVVIESWDELRVLETLTGLAVRRGLGLHTWVGDRGLAAPGLRWRAGR